MQELTVATSVQTAPELEFAGIRITEATQIDVSSAKPVSFAAIATRIETLAVFARMNAISLNAAVGSQPYYHRYSHDLMGQIDSIHTLVGLLRQAL